MKQRYTNIFISLAAALTGCANYVEEEVAVGADQAIVSGTQASAGEFPWQARLTISMDGEVYSCGGSLIANDWVVTAAHCVTNASGGPADSVTVTMGDHNTSVVESTEQTRNAVRFFAHPDYNATTTVNDIALVQLATPVTLNSSVATVAIASQAYSAGTSVTASGWGLVGASPYWVNEVGGAYWSYSNGTPVRVTTSTTNLMKVTTSIVSNATCQNGFSDPIQDTMLCAGTPGSSWYQNGSGTCNGDSGGPLVVKAANGTSTLVGITSFGNYFCSTYSVFTRVSAYSSWIAAVRNAVTRKGLTWGKFTANDAYLDALSTRGVDRLGCYGQPLINGSACNAYDGDTACTEKRPILCFKQDNSPRPAYKTFSGAYYDGWINGSFALTTPVSGVLLTSRAAGNQFCEKSFGTGWKMMEHHDGKYISGMSETAYFGATWTAAASSQQSGGWNGFGHGNVASTSRFWVAINDQSANCWGQ